MIPYEYVLFGQIQNVKADFYAEYGRGLSFQNAVQALIDRKEYKCGFTETYKFLLLQFAENGIIIGEVVEITT